MTHPTTMPLLFLLLLGLLLLGLLAACGGGGGGGGAPVEEVDPPVLTSQPSDEDVIEGETATFDVSATGEGTLTYAWQRSVGGGAWSTVAGASSSSYTTPATTLANDGDRYRCVVSNAGGSATSTAAALSVDPVPPWRRTIEIDGANDFTPEENFPASAEGLGFMTWDDGFLYVGMDSPRFVPRIPEEWFVAYIGGPSGTTIGVAIGIQEPALPFSARWCVRYRADGPEDAVIEALEWNGATWVDAGWDFTDDWASEESYLEIRIPLIEIGAPTAVEVHLSFVSDVDMEEATTSGVPDTSFEIGLDPDYTAYFEFDFLGSQAPNTYTPLP